MTNFLPPSIVQQEPFLRFSMFYKGQLERGVQAARPWWSDVGSWLVCSFNRQAPGGLLTVTLFPALRELTIFHSRAPAPHIRPNVIVHQGSRITFPTPESHSHGVNHRHLTAVLLRSLQRARRVTTTTTEPRYRSWTWLQQRHWSTEVTRRLLSRFGGAMRGKGRVDLP